MHTFKQNCTSRCRQAARLVQKQILDDMCILRIFTQSATLLYALTAIITPFYPVVQSWQPWLPWWRRRAAWRGRSWCCLQGKESLYWWGSRLNTGPAQHHWSVLLLLTDRKLRYTDFFILCCKPLYKMIKAKYKLAHAVEHTLH